MSTGEKRRFKRKRTDLNTSEFVPAAVPDSLDEQSSETRIFVNSAAKEFWLYASGKKMIAEKVLVRVEAEEFNLKELLVEENLWASTTRNSQYAEKIVREFYCNMPAGVDNVESPKYQRVFVRGRHYNISPKLFADAFECWNPEEKCKENFTVIVTELTGGCKRTWSVRDSALKPTELTSFYSTLHKIVVANWMPCRHTNTVSQKLGLLLFKIGTRVGFDLGEMTYDKIVSFAGRSKKNESYVHPTTIFTVLLNQGLTIGANEDFTQPETLKLTSRLVHGVHMVDINDNDVEVKEEEVEVLTPEALAVATDMVKFLRKQEYRLRNERLLLEARIAKS
ncbi:uncharacterized protein [Rutidosis leptorrhynchoides]|uniref:uncharacterized protein n=1 Tax=Rutidosis leptorrhynchoides TaxID=125765 RepID=UPI003A9A3D24